MTTRKRRRETAYASESEFQRALAQWNTDLGHSLQVLADGKSVV